MTRRRALIGGLAAAALCHAQAAPRDKPGRRLGVLLYDAAVGWDFQQCDLPPALAAALLQAGVLAVFEQRFYVEAGGLLSYRLDWDDQTRSTALQLAKVLRGEDPAAIPFELPTRSQLVINARSAAALGLALPSALRARADEVIA